MIKYYTNQLRSDGFGANYQTMIYAILYAEVYCNSEFVYTKPDLKTIYENEAEELENIMNLSKYFKSECEIENKSEISVVEIMHSYAVINSDLKRYLNSPTMNKIRNAFKENKNVSIFDNSFNNISIHIRRPSLHKNIDNSDEHKEGWDKTKMSIDELIRFTPRFTDERYFIDIISKINNEYTNKQNVFHIFSEGEMRDFSNFKGDNIVFHLNEDIKTSTIYMVMSDILVISKSAFSYSCALLNEKLTYNIEIY